MSLDATYMWYLKKKKCDTSGLIHNIGTDSEMKKTNLWLPKGKGWGRGIN